MTDQNLFTPYTLGALTLSNRIVLAPLTRNRAGQGFVPSEFAATYYSQRASAGLLISEATQISQQGQGYQDTPGIYTQAQIDGWRTVTDAVHAKGGKIFLQLWHVGRVSHVDLQENGAAPVAPSALRAATKVFVNNRFEDVSEPRALDISELPGIVSDFCQAAANALDAGFDGVEIHGANGYLLDQFLKDSANLRTDAYGGSIENRARLLLEVTAAVVNEIGADRTVCAYRRCRRPMAFPAVIRRRNSITSSTNSTRSAWFIYTWSKARPVARVTWRHSISAPCASASKTPTSPTTAMT
jgi:NADH:flavin oxidoreductases, Old Yellow Enzyme family